MTSLKRWNGSTWVLEPVKTWLGGAWTVKPLKRWTGSTWETITVETGGGTVPYITGLSVSSGGPGTWVTVTGTQFGTRQGPSTITFGGTTAPTSRGARPR